LAPSRLVGDLMVAQMVTKWSRKT